RGLGANDLSIDTQYGRHAHGDVQVGGALFHHGPQKDVQIQRHNQFLPSVSNSSMLTRPLATLRMQFTRRVFMPSAIAALRISAVLVSTPIFSRKVSVMGITS